MFSPYKYNFNLKKIINIYGRSEIASDVIRSKYKIRNSTTIVLYIIYQKSKKKLLMFKSNKA